MPIDQTTARENARRLMSLRGMTIKDLAERIGMSKATLYGWSKADRPKDLGPKALVAVAEALGVTTEALFSADLAEGGARPVDRITVRVQNPRDEKTPYENARAGVLREIDFLLQSIDDPNEQDRAADIILAALRGARDAYERRRTDAPGARRAGAGRADNASGYSRGPRK